MNKVLEVILKLTDQFTSPLQKSEKGVKGFGTSIASLATSMVSVGAIFMVLRKAFQAADDFRVSLQKLEGTAKITGVPLGWLKGIAADAERQFGLTKMQASDFAVEMAKLAAKAGDVGKAGPALQAFLDIGAARGLTAGETLKAVQQAILGIDEGTDKLFNANPSVLYAAFAAKIGTTAGKLTDQQKAQALLNAAMEDGSKVAGEYSLWLETVAGKSQMAANKATEAYTELGLALDELRYAMADSTVVVAGSLTSMVQALQLYADHIGYQFTRLPIEIGLLWDSLLVGVGAGIQKLGSLLPFVGDKFEEFGKKMRSEHTSQAYATIEHLNLLEQAHAEAQADILHIDITGAQARYNASILNNRKAADLDRTTNAARVGQERDAQAALKKLREGEAKAALEGMTALGRAMQELQVQMDTAMLSQDAATREEAVRLWKNGVSRMMMEYAKLEPSVRVATLRVRTELATIPPAFEEGGEAAEDSVVRWEKLKAQIGKTGAAIGKGAEEVLRFGRDIGAVNPQLEGLIGGIGRLAEGIGGIASGNLLQGMSSAVLGLQGIVGSLFGNSPAEQARKALLKENSVRLRELKSEIGDLLNIQLPGAKLAKFDQVSGQLGGLTGGGETSLDQMKRFVGFMTTLAKQGLTVTDAEELAKNLGVNLGIDNGRISAGAVQQFMMAIKSAEFSQFDQSFSGQKDFIETILGVAGNTNPQDRLNLIVNKLMGINGAPGFFAPLLSAGQATTAEGRAKLRDTFVDTLNQMNLGVFDVANFGQLSGSEFRDVLTTMADLFTEIDGAVGSVGSGAPVTITPAALTSPVMPGEMMGGMSTGIGVMTITLPGFDGMAQDITAIRKSLEERPGTVINADNWTINATDAAGVRSAAITAIDEALRIERDLSAVTQGA